MMFWLGFIAGIGAVCLLALIVLVVLLHGDVRAEDASVPPTLASRCGREG